MFYSRRLGIHVLGVIFFCWCRPLGQRHDDQNNLLVFEVFFGNIKRLGPKNVDEV